jgi:hypothetical protein
MEHRAIYARHAAAGGPTARWYVATLIAGGLVILGLLAIFATELLPG